MDKWKLVSDSSSDLTREEHSQCFSVPFVSAPLIVKVENTDYVDVYSTDPVEMTEHIRRWGKPCTTSCPSLSEYLKAFQDAENVICVTISSELSGSYNSALQAKAIILEEHPE
ncbi:MAG: DegV family protein, partial [Oscillospiraceae bacterium]